MALASSRLIVRPAAAAIRGPRTARVATTPRALVAPRSSSRRRPLTVPVRAAASGGSGGGDQIDIDALLAKYSGTGAADSSKQPAKRPASAPAPRAKPAAKAASASPPGNGVFVLLVINLVCFVLDHILHLPFMQALYLNHAHPAWYSWITHAFCHANFGHLSMNLFNLCVFGKLVEETEGSFGVVFTYIACALGAAAFAVLTQPAIVRGAVSVSLGASGAIFGLFVVSVLARISWDPRRLLEAVILGWFVVKQVLQEAQAQVAGGTMIGGLAVGHLAHLGGALAGVLLVLALKAIPDPDAEK